MFYELAGDWPSDAGCHVDFIFLILENKGRTNKEFYSSKLSQGLDNFPYYQLKWQGMDITAWVSMVIDKTQK